MATLRYTTYDLQHHIPNLEDRNTDCEAFWVGPQQLPASKSPVSEVFMVPAFKTNIASSVIACSHLRVYKYLILLMQRKLCTSKDIMRDFASQMVCCLFLSFMRVHYLKYKLEKYSDMKHAFHRVQPSMKRKQRLSPGSHVA